LAQEATSPRGLYDTKASVCEERTSRKATLSQGSHKQEKKTASELSKALTAGTARPEPRPGSTSTRVNPSSGRGEPSMQQTPDRPNMDALANITDSALCRTRMGLYLT